MVVLVDQVRVYVHSRDALVESGLHAQLEAWEAFSSEPCPSIADVAVLAWPELDDALLAKVEQLSSSGCSNVVLVLGRIEVDELSAIVAAGVSGVIRTCDASPGRLIESIQAAAGGGGSLPPDLLGHLLRQSGDVGRLAGFDTTEASNRLAEREKAVLELLSEGMDTNQIAESLHYSERTIKGIIHDVVRRFGLRNRPHAVAFALRHGLI